MSTETYKHYSINDSLCGDSLLSGEFTSVEQAAAAWLRAFAPLYPQSVLDDGYLDDALVCSEWDTKNDCVKMMYSVAIKDGVISYDEINAGEGAG